MLFVLLCAAADVEARAGFQIQGYGYAGGRTAQPFFAAGADGNGLFIEHLLLQGGVLAQIPLSPNGAYAGFAGVARIGGVFSGFFFTVGANVRIDATPSPVQALPALTLGYKPHKLGVRGGFMDQAGGPLAHIAFEYGNLGIGYVAPLGAEAYAKINLTDHSAIDARFWGYSAGPAYAMSLLVGYVWE